MSHINIILTMYSCRGMQGNACDLTADSIRFHEGWINEIPVVLSHRDILFFWLNSGVYQNNENERKSKLQNNKSQKLTNKILTVYQQNIRSLRNKSTEH